MLFTNRLYLFFFSIHLLFTNGLRAWTIENIVNNTASPIQVVFSQGDKAIITATIPPQSILPFFQKCPFAENLKEGFSDCTSLSSRLTITVEGKNFHFAEGKYIRPTPSRYRSVVGTLCLTEEDEGSIFHSLGCLSIRPHSHNLHANILVTHLSSPTSRNPTRTKLFVGVDEKSIKYVTSAGRFSTSIEDAADEPVEPITEYGGKAGAAAASAAPTGDL